MNFYNFGYYIVEAAPKPEYLVIKCKQILTATNCLCNLYPSLKVAFWFDLNNKLYEKEQQDHRYRDLLNLSNEEFSDFKEATDKLYSSNKLDVDSRFVNLYDALLFREKYLHNLPCLKVISIAYEDIFEEIVIKEKNKILNGVSSAKAPLSSEQEVNGKLIGYDILGWDYGRFHSYLCNSLDGYISKEYNLKVNDLGLIQNDYEEVKKFTELIKNEGEDVIWLPFAVYEHTVK